MTDAQRCEPPEHLRGVDGWHWLASEDGDYLIARWCDNSRSLAMGWRLEGTVALSAQSATNQRFRYLAPVAPPDLVRALVEALEWYSTVGIGPGGEKARAALARAKGAGV
jgi:hypothetical protein